ncbi:MAG: DUF5686 family protein [Bacteroidetes bacterium]|nr:DUF5686 family protein [Bacteroidota bacterium]
MKQLLLYGLCLFLFSFKSEAQTINLSGKIIDAQAKQAIAFVNVIIKGSNKGTQTDFDGNWSLENIPADAEIEFVMIGFERPLFKAASFKTQYPNGVYQLKKSAYDLREVLVLPGINPAHRIIEKVLKNKKKNNWEKLESFTFNSYNKFTVTRDTLDAQQKLMMKEVKNSNVNVSVDFGGGDSNTVRNMDSTSRAKRRIKAKEREDSFFNSTHAFISESVVEKKFKHPDKVKERVLAAKISGTKDLRFSLLNSQFNNFNIYSDYIQVYDKKYLSPISYSCIKHYLFVLEDSIYSGADTIYIISYRPYSGKLFDGFNGVLYINTNRFAVQNVIARPQQLGEGFNTEVRQKSEFMEGKYWFPSQLNSKILFTTLAKGRDYLMGVGRTYFRDIVFNPELKNREFNAIALEYDKKAGDKDSSYWLKSRVDSLTIQDKNTYKLLDSIGKKEHIDQKIKFYEALLSGKLKYNIIDIDLNKIVNYNGYEGWRLGAGANTNSDLSPYFSVGGFYAYGFKDTRTKYGGELGITPVLGSPFKIGGSYTFDVMELGYSSFGLDRKITTNELVHLYNMNRMFYAEKTEVFVNISPFRYMTVQPLIRQSNEVIRGYSYQTPNGETNNHFKFLETSFGIKYAYKEKFTQVLDKRYSNGTNYPIIWLQITQGFVQKGMGDFDYLRIEAKVEKTIPIKLAGATKVQIKGGYVTGNVPITRLFDPGSNHVKGQPYASENRFETMRMYEFMADQYAVAFITHSFEKLLFRYKKINPVLELHTNLGWGSIHNPQLHQNISFKSMDKGYIESGVSVEDIYKSAFSGLGVGVYYRYGANQLPRMQDNFAVKLTLRSNINW